jgi:hypothetical protein
MSDRELKLLKRFENIDIYNIEKGTKTTDTDFHLSAHYDGSVNMAIGYGLDLYVNSWSTIKKYLEDANEKADSDFDFEKTYTVSEDLNYTFETIVNKYKTDFKALSTEEKGVLRKVLYSMKDKKDYKTFIEKDYEYEEKVYGKNNNTVTYNKIKTFCEDIIKPLVSFPLPSGEYAGKLMEVMAPKYRNTAKNRLNSGDYDKLLDCQKGALLSLAYNSPSLIGNNLKGYIAKYIKATDPYEKVKYRTLAWAEIRYGSNSNKLQGLANRRYQESDYWGLVGENDTDDEMYYNHQLGEIAELGLEEKLMIKIALEKAEMNYNKPGGGKYTIQGMAEKYETDYPTTHRGTKYSFTIAQLLKAVDVKVVDVILAQIQAADRKIDTVAKAFLEKYDGQADYSIDPDPNGVIRKSVTKILENSDVTIFNLMQWLVLETKKASGQASDQVKLATNDFIKKCKTNLEAVIKDLGDYKRPGYEGDNQGFPDELNSDRAKDLATAFGELVPVQTPKCKGFFESFLTEEEEKTEEEQPVQEDETDDEEVEQVTETRPRGGHIIWYDETVGEVVFTTREEYDRRNGRRR